ncbi:hypothetical protein CERSUDRAFT_159121 [Gelatoporia subvermispora B]|uniref:C2H2-type domain-containing protein n=1 Tax=Ceriporiopsis subvermispora (strain B) TaxID=914234 RepID=M2QAB7_CERS8|nr:hypothetical protein CERSUDRAFT_159121 [Gelatoporia subvermispora B]
MQSCDRCRRGFANPRALQQHRKDSSAHSICDDCDEDYPTGLQLLQHWLQSPIHHYCKACDVHFDSFDILADHHKRNHHYCATCNMVYDLDSALHEHLSTTHSNLYCLSCKRIFQSESNLDNHLRSSTHQAKNLYCPGLGCRKSFVSTSALVHHLESGACRSGITRDIVDRGAAMVDREGTVINHARLLQAPEAPSQPNYIVTRRAWNGAAYECCICHRTCASLSALDVHIQSPVHSQKIYRCPVHWRGCGQEFKVISAFCQHIDSGKCGVLRFKCEADRALLTQGDATCGSDARVLDPKEPTLREAIFGLVTLIMMGYGLYHMYRSRHQLADWWSSYLDQLEARTHNQST